MHSNNHRLTRREWMQEHEDRKGKQEQSLTQTFYQVNRFFAATYRNEPCSEYTSVNTYRRSATRIPRMHAMTYESEVLQHHLCANSSPPDHRPPRAELPMSAPSALRSAPHRGWRAAGPRGATRGASEGTAAPHRPRLPSRPFFSERPAQLPAPAAPHAPRAPPPRLPARFGLRSRSRGAPPPPPPLRSHRGAGAQPRRAAALPGRPRSAAAEKRILGQRPMPASERAFGGSARAGAPLHPPRPSSSPFSFPRLKSSFTSKILLLALTQRPGGTQRKPVPPAAARPEPGGSSAGCGCAPGPDPAGGRVRRAHRANGRLRGAGEGINGPSWVAVRS